MEEKAKKIPDSYYYDGRKKKWKIENINGKIERPCKEVMDKWLKMWDEKEGYIEQENALDKLFFQLCPENSELDDILIKCCTLNDFYSTNIYKVLKVAQIIREMGVDLVIKSDKRNPAFVEELCNRVKNATGRGIYSFATKYMSHHRPDLYPIYDSFVAKILRYFRDNEGFKDVDNFSDDELENYTSFCRIIDNFKVYFSLQNYSVKDVDKLLWQMGKYHFPKYQQ